MPGSPRCSIQNLSELDLSIFFSPIRAKVSLSHATCALRRDGLDMLYTWRCKPTPRAILLSVVGIPHERLFRVQEQLRWVCAVLVTKGPMSGAILLFFVEKRHDTLFRTRIDHTDLAANDLIECTNTM